MYHTEKILERNKKKIGNGFYYIKFLHNNRECLHELMNIPYIIQQLDAKSRKNTIFRNHSVEQAHTYDDQDDDEHTTHSIEN